MCRYIGISLSSQSSGCFLPPRVPAFRLSAKHCCWHVLPRHSSQPWLSPVTLNSPWSQTGHKREQQQIRADLSPRPQCRCPFLNRVRRSSRYSSTQRGLLHLHTCSTGTGTLQRVWWPWVLTKVSLHHPGNLADVSGVMMVFYPWKFSSRKYLTIGDSNKFSDVLGMYRSWLKCNFTDTHEVTSELIHPCKLDFISLSASLLPFRNVCAVSPQGQTHCLLELKPKDVLPRSGRASSQAQVHLVAWEVRNIFSWGSIHDHGMPRQAGKASSLPQKGREHILAIPEYEL